MILPLLFCDKTRDINNTPAAPEAQIQGDARIMYLNQITNRPLSNKTCLTSTVYVYTSKGACYTCVSGFFITKFCDDIRSIHTKFENRNRHRQTNRSTERQADGQTDVRQTETGDHFFRNLGLMKRRENKKLVCCLRSGSKKIKE